MNVLIIGSGAREHAFCWKLQQSRSINQIFVAPGNAGTSLIAKNLDIDILNFEEVKREIINLNIELVIVGPEIPLIEGIVDFIYDHEDLKNVLVIGPTRKGAMLEGSKDFSKEFMIKHSIPTAAHKTFSSQSLSDGLKYLDSIPPPFVLKADGPAAGKGVLILDDLDKAKSELINMLQNNKFGKSGTTVVIEEFLDGIELSCFVLTDGESYKILPYAKDYKRVGEGDTGLNTGGMGSISPVPFATTVFLKKVEDRIIKPTIEGLKKDKIPYKGFIFVGIIKVNENPYVIEYNVRMGDPETQVVLPRIKSDFLELMKATATQTLKNVNTELFQYTYSNVVMVAGGYPESYKKGNAIKNIPKNTEDSIIFHAGTKHENNTILTNGGRILSIVSKGLNHQDALMKAYRIAAEIDFKEKYYRKDIGFDL